MSPRFFLLLLLFSTSFLTAQQDFRYRRGVSVSLEFGLATDPVQVYNIFQPTDRGSQLLSNPEGFSNAIPFRNPDSLAAYFKVQPVSDAARVRTAAPIARYYLQAHLLKKVSSGLEYGGGLFLSSGRFAPALASPPRTDDDYVFRSFAYNYLRSGLSGSLKFHLWQRYRLQPYLGVQTLFLLERRWAHENRWQYPARGLSADVFPLTSDNTTTFDLDIQLLGGFDFPVTERLLLGCSFAFLGTTGSTYGGLRIGWVLTDY